MFAPLLVRGGAYGRILRPGSICFNVKKRLNHPSRSQLHSNLRKESHGSAVANTVRRRGEGPSMSSLCNHLSTNAFELQPFSGTRRCRFSTVPPGKSSGDVPGDASAGNFIMRNVPAGLLPYAYLARMDKPIGTMLLLYPCWWSTALAAAPTGSAPDFKLMALFGLGAFVMRGAGCTINDMWDRDFDKNVERTQVRVFI